MKHKGKDFEINISVHMRLGRKLFLITTAITWVWTIGSTIYYSYVARTGKDPFMDYTVGIPTMLADYMHSLGVWGIIFSGIIMWIVLLVISSLIVRYKNR